MLCPSWKGWKILILITMTPNFALSVYYVAWYELPALFGKSVKSRMAQKAKKWSTKSNFCKMFFLKSLFIWIREKLWSYQCWVILNCSRVSVTNGFSPMFCRDFRKYVCYHNVSIVVHLHLYLPETTSRAKIVYSIGIFRCVVELHITLWE